MASAANHFAKQLNDYFNADDFTPVQAAGKRINAALREDEAAPDADLHRRITASSPGSHLYFPTKSSANGSNESLANNRWKHVRSDPLPRFLAQKLETVQSHSLMGLLTPASLAWMSVDHNLFLWSFRRQDASSFSCFEVPSRQCVVSVGLVVPKKGVFTDAVKWCLVVTTPVEIHLCALAQQNQHTHQQQPPPTREEDSFRLVPTSFTLPTDGVRMLSVAGTDSGRIFLGGDDGCLYEMIYEGRIPDQHLNGKDDGVGLAVEDYLDQFYDEGVRIAEVITTDNKDNVTTSKLSSLGKRSWTSTMSSSSAAASNGSQPRKCRKLNRTAHASSLVTAALPDFVTRGASFLFGGKTSTGGGRIVQMVMDEPRQTLYTLSAKGWICAFDVRPPGVRLASVTDATKTARLYLEAVSRGQAYAPNTSHQSSLGSIVFPGGSWSAQAGVGGMDGARAILKAADVPDRPVRKNGAAADRSNNLLRPVSIHVVHPTESSQITLVAITSGGLRLYLSSLATNVLYQGPAAFQSNSYMGSVTPANSRVLTPTARMTLWHIRSSPSYLLDSADASTVVVGGVTPGLSPRSTTRVDASLYEHGVLVAAVEFKTPGATTNNRTATVEPSAVGDFLVATCPDSVARKPVATSETAPINSTGEKPKEPKLVIPGGISESASVPMSGAYGTWKDGTFVPGGIIWSIASTPERDSPVVRLASNSQTPSEAELDASLPAAFFPPSKVYSVDEPTLDGSSSLSSRAIVARDVSAATVLGNVLASLLFSRSIRTGIISQPGERAIVPYNQQFYRLSKRDCSQGFSSTAGETARVAAQQSSRSQSSSSSPKASPVTSKSTRLRPWLLRPATVPLNELSIQHLAAPREIVALNAGGLHYFQVSTLLQGLAESIEAAGNNVSTDANVTSFFTGYGYKEGCSLCLALAVGCGPGAGNSALSEQVRLRAMDAVFARALKPRLIAQSDQQNGNTQTVVGSVPSSSDPLVPQGYEFESSALSDGLSTFSARLLRPIWHKPAIVVTEGPSVRRQWSTGTRVTPAKVEVLVDEASVEEICNPLRNLLGLMKHKLSRAIVEVPGMPKSQDMEVDSGNNEKPSLSQALQYQSHLHAGQSGVAAQLTPAETTYIAHLIEEKNIHSLYRLLARVVQLLDLITLLRRAQGATGLREVDWGLLHGLTIAQLVQTSEGQDRLESLLNALVTASASDQSASPALSEQADRLAERFADACYLFFSPGSRYAYFGLRNGAQAMAHFPSSQERMNLARQAAQYFQQAAQHWHSAPLITGRILHKKGKESYSQNAQRAIQCGSPLASAVGVLIQLGDVANALDICLSVASNFKRTGRGQDSQDSFGQSHPYELGWEQNMYHKRRYPVESNTGSSSEGTLANSSSRTQIVAYGAEVTAQDAVDTCYALVFHHLSLLLGVKSRNSSDQELALGMVSECAGANDNEFLSAFFLHLLESENADTLLRINSPELEKWLRDRKEPDLLWRYYSIQGRHLDAGQVLQETGTDSTTKTILSFRIECLSKALNSIKTALLEEQRAARFNVGANGELTQRANAIEETLQVARIQNKILHIVDTLGSALPPEITADMQERLRTSLVPVTDLYNNYAAVLDLYEFCLQMFHVCRREDADSIKLLWKHIISKELIPCTTRSDATYTFLQSFVRDIGRGDEVLRLDASNDTSIPVFENGEWIQRLEGKLVAIGQELYGKGADYVFPLHFLLFHLEELRQALHNKLEPEWPLLIFAKVGVPYLLILDTYEGVVLRDSRSLLVGEDDGKRHDQTRARVGLLQLWVSSAQSSPSDNSVRRDLARAETSGRLLRMIEEIEDASATMGDDLIHRIRSIKSAIISIG